MSTLLFDMDGTLLDTEKWYCKAWSMAAKTFGYDMTDEQAQSMRSLGRPFCGPHVKEMFGPEADVEAIRGVRREIMKPWFEGEIPLKPKVVETMTELRKRGHHLAVVTASNPERTKKLMTKTGMVGLFDQLICVSMVQRGKPAPDVYLYACEQMGIDPKDAFAVEDSPNGVISAYEAGCKTIMIPDLTEPDEELAKLLYRRADQLSDLLDIVEKDNVK